MIWNYYLGGIAKVNARLARIRVNGIPVNFALIVGLGFYSASLWRDVMDAIHNSQTPMPVSVAQLESVDDMPQRYVEISGVLLPKVVYRIENGTATEWWSPLLDPQQKRVLLVKQSGTLEPEATHMATVTGMLRSIHGVVRRRLADDDGRIDGMPVETRYELEAGERPAEPARSAMVAGLVSLILGSFCLVMFRRNVIFHGGGSFATPLASIPARQQIAVRATGRFVFDAKNTRRFVDVPAILAFDQGPPPVIMSKIDTSQRFMGMTTRENIGMWYLSVKQGTIQNGRFGFQFFGLSRRYAFRFSYVDARNGKASQGVIAADEPERVVIAAAGLTGMAYPNVA